MIYFVGAGSGAADLITVRGQNLIKRADVVIYAGSLVNPALLNDTKKDCLIYDSAKLNLPQVLDLMKRFDAQGKEIVRLHTGDPCLYGAVREQMDALDECGIAYESCPGVSSFCGAAAALGLEYTLPGITQTVILTRMAGRTDVPERESIEKLASHGATMVLFLSAGMAGELQQRLMDGGYRKDTPAAIVYKATWPEEQKFCCSVGTLEETMRENKITKTALIIVGDVVAHTGYEKSKLYDPTFETGFRKAKGECE